MEKIIGLMGAMREEIALLCERMTDKVEETVAGVTFYTGLLQGRRVALCCGHRQGKRGLRGAASHCKIRRKSAGIFGHCGQYDG